MTGILSALEKELGTLRAKKEKQQKLVADLTAPLTELERLTEQEAEQRAAFVAAQAELEQLQAERSDAQGWLDRIAPALPHLEQTMTVLGTLEGMLATGHLRPADMGMDQFDLNRTWAAFRNVAVDQVEAQRAIVARTSARIKELGGE